MKQEYFYIVKHDGQIFERKYTQESFTNTFNEWRNGGILVLADLGVGLQAGTIAQIIRGDSYQNFIETAKLKQFPYDGGWYDGKDKSFIRYEDWKQKELDEVKRLEEKTKTRLPQEQDYPVDDEKVLRIIREYTAQIKKGIYTKITL